MIPLDPPAVHPLPRKRRSGLVIAVAAGAIVLMAGTAAATVALTANNDPSAGRAPAPASVSSTTAAPPPPPAAIPSPTPPAVHHFGEEVTEPDATGRYAVFGFKQPVARTAPRPDQDGFEWAAADVQVCARADNVFVNRAPWYLVYADHTTINSSGTGYGQFPEPAYPWGDTAVPNGHCVRGWIVFPAPIGKAPVAVQHNIPTSVVDWSVS
jgi:hypothetical protein